MKGLPIARDGFPYLVVLAIIAVGFYFVSPFISLIPLSLFFFVAFFFRNPKRSIPKDPSVVVSPADGVIMDIDDIFEERFLKGPCKRVSIFLSLFNVHINRSPIEGKVLYRYYPEGKMLPAFKSHASELNEKNFIGIQNDDLKILVTQVTGFIARRIVCWVREGDLLGKGERFGLIKFGSCTEIFLPPEVEILVKKGDKVRGGESIIGRLPDEKH